MNVDKHKLEQIEKWKSELKIIKDLNITDQELINNYYRFFKYVKALNLHNQSDTICEANHFNIIRDKTNKLQFNIYLCDKQIKTNSLNDNILICDYENNDDYQMILKNTNNTVFKRSDKRQKFTNYFKTNFLDKKAKDKQAQNCFIYGDTLSGKSFAGFYLLKCCVHFKQGKKVAYINIKNFCNKILDSYNSNNNQSQLNKYFDVLYDVDYLFIDEIGTEKQSPTSLNKFASIIKERSKSKSKTTILISSKNINKLKKYYTETILNKEQDNINDLIVRIKEIAKENEIEIDKVI